MPLNLSATSLEAPRVIGTGLSIWQQQVLPWQASLSFVETTRSLSIRIAVRYSETPIWFKLLLFVLASVFNARTQYR
jgi:hypothetical protein